MTEKLWNIQDHKCFICSEPIDLKLHTTNIDHIIPLANKGKDSEENFAVTHESCNKSIKIARTLYKLKKIQEDTLQAENKSASLKQLLVAYSGSKYDFKYTIKGDKLSYSFSELGDNKIYETEVHTDFLSNEKTCFISFPLEYIYHDELINPRGINNSISKLVKEFDKKNPQLHLSLGRVENNKIKIFDGQHKAVAQILLGNKRILIRVFIKPDIDRLTETNTNAGNVLSQIAFDKSVMRQLNNTLYNERIKKYQEDHNLKEDDLTFSEQKLVEYFKGNNANVKKYITEANENKLKDYIDRDGKAKGLPISYSAFDKSFLTTFIDSKQLLATPINFKSDEGLNPRELEISQAIKLLNILADEIYISKFQPEIGVTRIESKIVDGKDIDISDNHLIAYRMSKEEILINWLSYISDVINNYFSNTGKKFNKNSVFQQKFDDQLWTNITNFVKNLKSLPLWKDRSKPIFAGKNNYDYWRQIFETGQIDKTVVLSKPINYVEMIKPLNDE